jgi:hypothetical protein
LCPKSAIEKCGKVSGQEKRLTILGTVELHDMISTKEQWALSDITAKNIKLRTHTRIRDRVQKLGAVATKETYVANQTHKLNNNNRMRA